MSERAQSQRAAWSRAVIEGLLPEGEACLLPERERDAAARSSWLEHPCLRDNRLNDAPTQVVDS